MGLTSNRVVRRLGGQAARATALAAVLLTAYPTNLALTLPACGEGREWGVTDWAW